MHLRRTPAWLTTSMPRCRRDSCYQPDQVAVRKLLVSRRSPRRQYSWLLSRFRLSSRQLSSHRRHGRVDPEFPAARCRRCRPRDVDMLRWHGAEEASTKPWPSTPRSTCAGYWRQVRVQPTVTPVMLLLWIRRGGGLLYSVDPYLPPGTKPRWRDYSRSHAVVCVYKAVAVFLGRGAPLQAGLHPSQLGGLGAAVGLAVSARRASVAPIGDDP